MNLPTGSPLSPNPVQRGPGEPTRDNNVRAQLHDRRLRVNEAITRGRDQVRLADLLKEIDAALERLDVGTYGICEECHLDVGEETLRADPLARICLSHLNDDQQRAFERDLDLASSMQANLLPNRNLVHKGWGFTYHYEPAGSVSGDYCDVIVADGESDGAFYLVGDVSGKGVAASLMMAQLHAIFRTLIVSLPRADNLFSKANRLLSDSSLSTHFATLVCAETHPSGTVRLVNAGHCPPLLLTRNDVVAIESTGLPLGLFCNATYGCSTVELAVGESLILYTDGLTESRNGGEEEYGEHRLKSLLASSRNLAPQALVQAIVNDLSSFRGNVSLGDDLTIMVISRKG